MSQLQICEIKGRKLREENMRARVDGDGGDSWHDLQRVYIILLNHVVLLKINTSIYFKM